MIGECCLSQLLRFMDMYLTFRGGFFLSTVQCGCKNSEKENSIKQPPYMDFCIYIIIIFFKVKFASLKTVFEQQFFGLHFIFVTISVKALRNYNVAAILCMHRKHNSSAK